MIPWGSSNHDLGSISPVLLAPLISFKPQQVSFCLECVWSLVTAMARPSWQIESIIIYGVVYTGQILLMDMLICACMKQQHCIFRKSYNTESLQVNQSSVDTWPSSVYAITRLKICSEYVCSELQLNLYQPVQKKLHLETNHDCSWTE